NPIPLDGDGAPRDHDDEYRRLNFLSRGRRSGQSRGKLQRKAAVGSGHDSQLRFNAKARLTARHSEFGAPGTQLDDHAIGNLPQDSARRGSQFEAYSSRTLENG